jgi:hypothetical protein
VVLHALGALGDRHVPLAVFVKQRDEHGSTDQGWIVQHAAAPVGQDGLYSLCKGLGGVAHDTLRLATTRVKSSNCGVSPTKAAMAPSIMLANSVADRWR